jgi:hypothetical protein
MQYQVMTYRIKIPQGDLGVGDIVPMPEGWIPLAAMRQGETAVVLCYQEAVAPGGPDIVLTSLTPNTLAAGSTPATVDVLGSGFDTGCSVYADEVVRPTFYIDDTHLEYTARPDQATAGESHEISVGNAGGDRSNSLPFTFT